MASFRGNASIKASSHVDLANFDITNCTNISGKVVSTVVQNTDAVSTWSNLQTALNGKTTTTYVDTAIDNALAGLNIKDCVDAATTESLVTTFPGGVTYLSGVITQNVVGNGNLIIDTITLTLGKRLLVKNESNAIHNGIYTVTTAWITGTTPWVITRASDFDGTPTGNGEVKVGSYTLVCSGATSANGGSGFVVNSTSDIDPTDITVGTETIVFTQFSSGNASIIGGDGITTSGSIITADFNATNLKITATQLNTIQDIATSASPQFNVVTHGDGSASAPSVSFTNFPTSGMYTSTGTLGYTVSGSERMRINSTGYVGIGTTTPQAALDVRSDASNASYISTYRASTIASDSSNITLNRSRGSHTTPTTITSGDTIGTLNIRGHDGSTYAVVSSIYTIATEPFTVNNHGCDMRFVVTNVSSNTPTTRMNIGGDGIITVTNAIQSTSYGSGTNPIYSFNGSAGTGIFGINPDILGFATAGSERMRLDATGNVGIGNVAPAQKLDVTGNALVSGTVTAGTKFLGTYGTTTAPSYSFTADTNTGINSDTADVLTVSTAGLERMRIDAAGNVGIGTISPSVGLDIRGLTSATTATTRVLCSNATTTGAYLVLAHSRGSNVETAAVISSGDELGVINFDGCTGAATFATGASITALAAEAFTSVNFGTDMVFKTADTVSSTLTERMRILNSGNVGIGTTAPTQKLDVVGSIQCSGTIWAQGVGWNNLTYLPQYPTANSNSVVGVFVSNISTANTGAVGVIAYNLASTNSKVSGIVAAYLSKSGGYSVNGVESTNISSIGGGGQVNGILIENISTVSPSTAITAGIRMLSIVNPVATSNYGLYLDTTNSYHYMKGKTGMGATNPGFSTQTEILWVNGDINATGVVKANSITLTSDIRLKENIKDLTLGLDFINSMSPKTYTFKPTETTDDNGVVYTETHGRRRIGFIAQEVETLILNLGSTLQDYDIVDNTHHVNNAAVDSYGLRYTSIIPILVNAVKELSTKNITLEATVSTQHSMINDLLNRVLALELA
jgi:hypothetical protein